MRYSYRLLRIPGDSSNHLKGILSILQEWKQNKTNIRLSGTIPSFLSVPMSAGMGVNMINKAKRIICIIIILFLLNSCEYKITDVFISKYPNRITYVLGVDKTLDFEGLKLTLITEDGSANELSIDSESVVMGKRIKEIETDVDFNKAGVYTVRFLGYELDDSFAVQVIDENYADEIIKLNK